MTLLELPQRDIAKSAESAVEKYWEIILHAEIYEFGWVKDISSLGNAVCNVATESITAIEHADEFEETSQVFLGISINLMRTKTH